MAKDQTRYQQEVATKVNITSKLDQFFKDVEEFRKQNKLSLLNLGNMCGITAPNLCRYFKGRNKGLGADTFLAICVATGLDPLKYLPTLTQPGEEK